MRIFAVVSVLLCMLTVATVSLADEHSPPPAPPNEEYLQRLRVVHESLLQELAAREPLQKLLRKQSRSRVSLAEIIHSDAHWSTSLELQHTIVDNEVAAIFRTLLQDKRYSLAELMLTDGFGALLAAYPIPSDYWQGDEAKFYEPVKRGGLYVSGAKWDDSSRVYSFFLAIPVNAGKSRFGVLIAGIDVSLEYMVEQPLEELLKLKGI